LAKRLKIDLETNSLSPLVERIALITGNFDELAVHEIAFVPERISSELSGAAQEL
jgi:hypothetical protein